MIKGLDLEPNLRCIWSWCICLLACVMAATTMAQSPNPASASVAPLQEVTVTATRLHDHNALAHAVSGFVASHAALSARISQIGSWHMNVCPRVTGLRAPDRDFVTNEVFNVARRVGAPTGAAGKKCHVNVEIVFTREPQVLLDHIAKSHRILFGYYPTKREADQAMKFSGPVQAWYATGTRSLTTIQVDSDLTAMGMQPSGTLSRFGPDLHTDFLHVFIIANSRQVEGYPLHSIADYLSMLSLTRMAQVDQCAPLPSISDLFASGCATPVADSLTEADRIYLKALYSADLGKNLDLERFDIREQMMRDIEGK